MCLQCQSPRKRPCAGNGSHKYNLRTRISTPSPHVSQTSLLPPLARRPIAKRLRFASISSTSSLSSIFATPPSLPSTPAPPTQSHPLECEIKTANKKIANLVDFLSNEVGTSRKECDEIALEAERVRELVAHYSSEVTRLQTLHDTDLGGVNLMCYVQRAMHLPLLVERVLIILRRRIQECKHMFCLACLSGGLLSASTKTWNVVDLPPRLEDRRDPPILPKPWRSSMPLEWPMLDFRIHVPSAVLESGRKLKEERALTCAISSPLAAALGPAVQTNTNDDADSDVWAGIFL
ncbi:hypothetical protein EDC04DRAFT_2602878 [Pisolithus marmoratus]|nr:hypothetical protein EDC04DRAFT_2602878 [Pisolithus marmoratus]